jgi:hypothetical protein
LAFEQRVKLSLVSGLCCGHRPRSP